MNRTLTIAGLALASALLSPMVVSAMNATAPKAGEVRIATAAATEPAADVQKPASAYADACPRKVRVVYAGLGEGQDRRCEARAAQ